MKLFNIPVGSLGTNCYILASEAGNCVIIDPGAQAGKLLGFIGDNKLTPKKILLTHGHHDHIGALKEVLETDDNLKAIIGGEDIELITASDKSLSVLHMPDAGDFIKSRTEVVSDNASITLDELTIKVIATPGHTKGCVCYIVGDIIFSGDTLFYEEVGRCDLYGGSYPTIKRSLLKLCALPGDYVVYPGHGESTTLNHERKYNRYIAEALKEQA